MVVLETAALRANCCPGDRSCSPVLMTPFCADLPAFCGGSKESFTLSKTGLTFLTRSASFLIELTIFHARGYRITFGFEGCSNSSNTDRAGWTPWQQRPTPAPCPSYR